MSFFQILLILRRVFRRVKFDCHFFSYRSLLLSTSVLNDIYIYIYIYIMWLVGYDVSVMILLRINILSKIITETSYPKLTIKPHKLHYKYNLLASLLNSSYVLSGIITVASYLKLTIKSFILHYK